MELLKPNDPKMELLKKSAKHRQELEDEVKLISEQTEKIITNAVIIGGTLAVAYFLVRQFSGSSSSKKVKPQKIKIVPDKSNEEEGDTEEASAPGVVSQIGAAIATQATIFLLSIAKEKLSEYIQSQFEKKGKDNERS